MIRQNRRKRAFERDADSAHQVGLRARQLAIFGNDSSDCLDQHLPAVTIQRQIRQGIDLLVLMSRQGGSRVVAAISEVGEDEVRVLYQC